MVNWLMVWRGELAILTLIIGTWLFLRLVMKRKVWPLMLFGCAGGIAIEFLTEQYRIFDMAIYINEDISPFIIAGWAPVMAMLVVLSDSLYHKIYHHWPSRNWRIIIIDVIIGVPLFLSVYFIGEHLLKIWTFNTLNGWNSIISVINFPVEGFVGWLFLIIAMPAVVRYWVDSWTNS